MTKILATYDGHDPNSKGMPHFKECMINRGWVDFMVANDLYTKFPNTTLISNKIVSEIENDFDVATAAAKKYDINFEITKLVITPYQIIMSADTKARRPTQAERTIYDAAMSGLL